jgi:hypothetical protein
MKQTLKILGLLLAILPFVTGIGCTPEKKEKKILKDKEGNFEIAVPAAWEEESDLNDMAEVQTGHRSSDMFAIVLVDNKADLHEVDLQKHSDITRTSLENSLKAVNESEPKQLTIDGKPALQYEIRGAYGSTNLIYLHTTIEGSNRYYQIVAWTTPSRWEKNRSTLEKITEYFHEIKP